MDEYKVIRIKLNKNLNSSHCLYYKQHKVNKSENDATLDSLNKRTLFVCNCAPYLNESALKSVFSSYGKVDHVILCDKPTAKPFNRLTRQLAESKHFNDPNSDDEFEDILDDQTKNESEKYSFKVAYIVFAEAESIDRAMKKSLSDKVRVIDAQEKNPTVKIGFKKWISDYENSFIDEDELSKEIDEFMLNYDQNKDQKEKEEAEKLNQPDEDGWITVAPKSRKSNLPFTEKNIEKIKQKQKKKRQQMQLVNFYTFQMKESKKEYIAQLRKKFEDDKKKIEMMKQNRKFKPF